MLRIALNLMMASIVVYCSYSGYFARERGFSPIYLIPMFGLSIYVVIRLAAVAHHPRSNSDA